MDPSHLSVGAMSKKFETNFLNFHKNMQKFEYHFIQNISVKVNVKVLNVFKKLFFFHVQNYLLNSKVKCKW